MTQPSAAARRRAIQTLPDEAQVPVGWVRDLISDGEPFDGVGTNEAAEILGVEPRKLRRRHTRWERMQDRGQHPPVRVGRKNPDNPRSDLLFDRQDLHRYAGRNHTGRNALRLLEDGG